MKIVIVSLALLAAAASAARAQPPTGAGAGVVLGDPTGLTLKVFPGGNLAFDAGIGFSGDATFYGDALFYSWDLFPKPSRGILGAYLALGPRIETRRDAAFGIRTMGGASYWLETHPIEFFVEVGPVFQLTPDTGTDVDAGIGLRVYWGR